MLKCHYGFLAIVSIKVVNYCFLLLFFELFKINIQHLLIILVITKLNAHKKFLNFIFFFSVLWTAFGNLFFKTIHLFRSSLDSKVDT